MGKRQWIILSIIVGIIVLIGIKLASNNKDKGSEHEGKYDKKQISENLKYAKAIIVSNDTVDIIVEGYGRVKSASKLTITSEVQGRLMQGNIPFKTGQSFQKGQLLCRIDNTEALMQHEAKKANLIKSFATILPEIKIDFNNYFPAWENFYNQLDIQKALPQLPEIDDNKFKTFLASKGVLTEYYNLKSEEVKLSKYNVYAPFSGTIKAVKQEIGAYVNPGTPLADIIQTLNLEIPIPIEINDLPLVKKGQKAIVYSENKMQQWEGAVARVADFVDENTQTIDVYINVKPKKNQPLYNGMYVVCQIFCGEDTAAIEVVRRALSEDDKLFFISRKDSSVYTKNVDNKNIKILKQNKNTVILKGLENNEILIVEPIDNLSGNAKWLPLTVYN